MLRDWSSGTTAEVQHLGAVSKLADKAVVPDLIVSIAVLTVAVPRGRVLLVMSHNPIGEVRHSGEVENCTGVCNGPTAHYSKDFPTQADRMVVPRRSAPQNRLRQLGA